MTVATVPETNDGAASPVVLTPLQIRLEKARAIYDAEFTKVQRLRRRIVNATEKLVTAGVYAGQKREKWLILLAMQEAAEANGTS